MGKVLIIGSEGFIGKNLGLKFSKKKDCELYGADLHTSNSYDYNYYKVDRNSLNFDDIFKSQQFDLCINASGSGNVRFSIINPLNDFESNAGETFTLLDAIKKYNQNCRYIHFSSAAVYGNPTTLPVIENAKLNPVSPYGFHKLISEIICKEFVQLFNLQIIIVRPFSAYGPGLKKQLIWDLYKKIISEEVVRLEGTGNETRDFIYIADMVEAISVLVNKADYRGEIYNIGTGIETSIKEIVVHFMRLLSIEKKIVFDQLKRKGIPLTWKADISKLEQLGFSSHYNIVDGLTETITWLKKNA